MVRRSPGEGSIRKRGPGWEIRISTGAAADGTRRMVTRTVRGTRKEAEQYKAALMLEIGRGEHLGSSASVGDLLGRFLAVSQRTLSPTTFAEYRGVPEVVPDFLLKFPLWKVRAMDLENAYREMADDGVNVHRIRRAHEVLSASFGKAIKWGWLERNPAQHASPPPRPRTERGAASAEDVRKLLDVCPPKLKLWVRLAFVTGARRGEVCGLKWQDVLFDRGVLVIRRTIVATTETGLVVKDTKTGKVHVVALDPETVRLLEEHAKAEGEVCGQSGATLSDRWLFTHDVGGAQPWRPDYVTLTIRRLQAKIGVNFPIHSIRHGTATELLDGGFALGVASERLGHDNQTTTARIYAHALPARDREAAEYLAGRLE